MASVRKREWTYKGEKKTAFVCEYTDGGGKRRRKTFDKKKDADRFRDSVAMEVRNGEHTPESETMTVIKAAEEWLKEKDRKVRSGSERKAHYVYLKSCVNLSIKPFFGSKLLSSLNRADVLNFAEFLRVEKKYVGTTVKKRMQALAAIEDWAVNNGYTKKTVVRNGMRGLKYNIEKTVFAPTKEEVLKILAAFDHRPPYFSRRGWEKERIFVNLAVFCGLRKGELMGLRVDSLDFERSAIKVRTSYARYDGLKGPKSKAGVRDVPCPAHVMGMLKAWMETYHIPNDLGLVFTTEGNKPYAHSGAGGHARFHSILKIAGLYRDDGKGQMHFHALRHFAGSLWLENGAPIPLVSNWLGHASPAITMGIYIHSLQADNERVSIMTRSAATLLGGMRQESATAS